MNRNVAFERLFCLSEVIGERTVVQVTSGPDLAPIILTAEATTRTKSGTPPIGVPTNYRLHHLVGARWCTIELPEATGYCDHAQPLGPDRWLLIRSRTADDGDANATVYTAAGRLTRSFHAGDGIEHVQVSEHGDVWIGFFDEGVYSDVRLGQAGLICLNDTGKVLFRFSDLYASGQVPVIDDCYALNLAGNDEVWLYYYNSFPLVRIVGRKLQQVWAQVPVAGAHAIAVADDWVLFAGSYKRRHSLFLWKPDSPSVQEFIPTDENGQPLRRFRAFGRGSRLFLIVNETVYAKDLTTVDG